MLPQQAGLSAGTLSTVQGSGASVVVVVSSGAAAAAKHAVSDASQ